MPLTRRQFHRAWPDAGPGGALAVAIMYIAAKFGRVSSVELLLTSGADPVRPWGKTGFTPLHVAAQEGDVENVRLLLRAGVDPDVRNKLKQTALWQVSWQRHQRVVEIANVLIDAGANVDAADTDGWTPLHMAVRHDNRALLESLIRRGANVGARTNRGNTALSLAIIEERHEALRVMMKAGANVNVSNGSDYAPLQTAVWRGEVALVDMLLKHGADANAAVNPVDLPLYLAIQRGHTEIARVLLNAGAKWDVEADGWTAIQRAAREGNVAMVQELIYRGANPTTPSSVAPPALLIAAESGQLPVVSMLVESGIDPNLRWHNWSALRIAGTRKHYPVVDYLRAHGAN